MSLQNVITSTNSSNKLLQQILLDAFLLARLSFKELLDKLLDWNFCYFLYLSLWRKIIKFMLFDSIVYLVCNRKEYYI